MFSFVIEKKSHIFCKKPMNGRYHPSGLSSGTAFFLPPPLPTHSLSDRMLIWITDKRNIICKNADQSGENDMKNYSIAALFLVLCTAALFFLSAFASIPQSPPKQTTTSCRLKNWRLGLIILGVLHFFPMVACWSRNDRGGAYSLFQKMVWN